MELIMASDETIIQVVGVLMGAFPNFRPVVDNDTGGNTVDVYIMILGDLPDALVKAAVLRLAGQRRQFAPSAGEVRAEAIDMIVLKSKLPGAGDAYQEVINMPRDMEKKYTEEGEDGACIVTEKLGWSHPIVGKVARMIGFPDRFPSDNTTADRAQFLKFYEAESKKIVDDYAEIPVVKKYLDKPVGNEIKKLVSKLTSK